MKEIGNDFGLSPAIEVELDGMVLYIRKDDLECSDGALMPSPNHDINSYGMGDSYAHLFPDGFIRRYNEVIGKKSDLLS